MITGLLHEPGLGHAFQKGANHNRVTVPRDRNGSRISERRESESRDIPRVKIRLCVSESASCCFNAATLKSFCSVCKAPHALSRI